MTADRAAGAAPRRRGRWKRVLVWTLLALVAVVALAPLWSAPLLAGVVERQLEARLDAGVRVQGASFAWPARVRVRGIELADRAGAPLAALDELEASVALLPLLRGAVHAEVEVRYPELHVSRGTDGRWNWEGVPIESGAREREEEEGERPDGAGLPDVVVRLRITDGHVVVHGADGDTVLSEIGLSVDVDGLESRAPFALRLAVRGPRGAAGELRIDGDFQAASGGSVSPETAAGRIALVLDELDLAAFAPALALALPAEGLAGRLAGSAELTLEPGLALAGSADVSLHQLALRGPLASEAARIDTVHLLGNATQHGEGAGTQRVELTADSFLALAYEGTSDLPASGAGAIAGTLSLEADLARLADVARGWVPFQEGVAVEGRLDHALELAATLRDREPVAATVTARGGVTNLAARDAGGRALDLSGLQALALELDASMDLARGTLELPRLDLRAGPLVVTARGSASGVTGTDAQPRLESGALTLDADLESLRSTLAQLVELGDDSFGGRLTARATLAAAAGAVGAHDLTAEVDGRALALGGTSVRTLRGEVRGRRGADGAVSGAGGLDFGGIVLAAPEEGGAALALPDCSARVEVQADARGEGRHVLRLDSVDGALALELQARTDRFDDSELAVRTVVKMDARLAPLAGIAAAVAPLSAGIAGDLHGTGDLHARIVAGALASAGGKLDLNLTDLTARDAAGRDLPLEALARTTLALEGDLDARAGTAELRSLALAAGGLTVRASGRAAGLTPGGTPAVEDGRLRVEADLARLGPDLARALEVDWTVGGSPLAVEAQVAGSGGRIDASGRVAGAELVLSRAGSEPIVQRELAVEFDVGYDGDAASLHVRRARAGSSTGSITLAGTLNELDDPARTRGTVKLDVAAELERVMTDLGLEPPESGRATSGPLSGSFQLDGDSGAFRVTGAAAIEPFRLVLTPAAEPAGSEPASGRGAAAPAAPLVIEEPTVALALDARVELEPMVVSLQRLTLTSGLARGGAQGRVLAGTASEPLRFERFTGELAYVPERLGAVLGPLLPGKLEGTQEERVTFALDGPLDELDLASVIERADARVELGLGRFVRPEITLGGTLGLEAKEGHATLRGDLTANGGTLQLDGVLDLSETPKPRSKLTATANAVRLNAGLAPLLARIHPMFAGASLTQGALDGVLGLKLDLAYDAPLTLEELEAGWDALPKTPISGSGSLELKELSLRGSPLLSSLAELGLKAPEKLAVRPIQFTVQRGRLVYAEPWTWTLGTTQTTFTGSVGLDQTLDLAWNVPITDELVAKHSYLRYLAGQTLSIPLRGTMTSPRLELSKLLEDLAAQAAKRELESRLGLGGGGKDDPSDLLKRADELWGKGQKADAAALYARLRDEFKLSLAYALNKDRIRERSKYKDQ